MNFLLRTPATARTTLRKKINHFIDSGTRPITCATIAEKGFQCPRMVSGECKCKSPAALCYQPLSIGGIRSLIVELPVRNALAEDLKTASTFIREYIFNADMETAFSVINIELKERFNFKGAVLKTLNAVYKEASKAYSEGLKTRMQRVETDLPLWYKPSSTGLRFMPGVLAAELEKTEKVFYAAEQHYLYGNGVYSEMPEMEAQHMCQQKMLVKEAKMSQIVDAEKQWTLRVRKDIKDINANPFIINCRNGLFNVLEDTLSPHTPDYYSTVQLSVSYDPEADCPKFKKFLAESMDGDMEQVALLQEMLGYFLIPINSAQKCFLIVGAAGAGKSVLLRVLNELLLGKENVSNVSWQALNERFKTAELFGKLANIFADLPTKNIEDNGIFKALVGEDFLTVEKKNRNPFSFQSTARLLFSCNNIPKNYGDRSEGYREKADHLREMAKSCTPRITDMPGPATRNPHSMADKIDMAVYYDCMADRLEKELSTITSTFHSSIQSIQKQEYREILTKRYIDHMSWAAIADQVGYDVRSVQRINSRCLSSIQFPKLPHFPDHDEYRLPGCTPK